MFKENLGKKTIIGLIHLIPMPGTPFYQEGNIEKCIEKAVKDAQSLVAGGAQGGLIQSSDRIYPSTDDTDYVRVSTLSVIANEVKKVVPSDFIIGVQLMWNCITPSLAVAKAVGADFTRCTALVGSTESMFGKIDANPLKVMEYRKKIGAEKIDMLAEISGYHFKGEYDKSNLLNLARSAMNVGANAIEIVSLDEELNNRMVQDVKGLNPNIPVILGGGTNVENAQRRLKYADGALVGACFEDGNWGGPINPATVEKYMKEVSKI